jgi:tetratricopeptide (TPR) repeat protein
MMRIALTLIYDGQAPHAVAAWFIPSSDPAEWLAEIARWDLPFDRVRLCLLPRSATDRRLSGALAILPDGHNACEIVPSPIVQPYGCVAGRLYLPAGARLHPPVSDAELTSVLLYAVQVFHPAIGPIGYADEDIVIATDLLARPTPVAHDWDHADPGLSTPPPLRSVIPMITPTVEQIQNDSRDDIGSAASEQLPRLPDESLFRALAAKAGIGMLGALSWLAAHLPRGGGAGGGRERSGENSVTKSGASPGGAGWGQRFERWSAQRIAALRQSLARARHKELARLLKLLETDMDQALRHALPLYGTAARGLARPGARLGLRNPDFDLAAARRAGAIDPWDVSAFQQQLVAKYREAANRELALGRYRRAAYIFAQLLGDFGSAANVLKQGRFYREAATLYREQLKDPAAAAACLEAGGLLLEAIPLYESLGRHEKVGDLYATLQRQDDAEHHYRQAVKRLFQGADLLGAARILETKLNVPDEALATLESGWPQSHQAAACLREAFELMGRRGRHEEATRRLARLRPELKEGELALALSGVLARVAASYPNPELRLLAADAARLVVGNRLAGDVACGASEMRALLNSLMRLTPDDRLLARDANRYVERGARPARPPAPTASGRKPPSKAPALVRAFHLGGGMLMKTVFSAGDHFYALGARDDQLIFVRGRWDGTLRSTQRQDPLVMETVYRIERAGRKSAALYAVPLRRADAPPPRDFGPDPAFPAAYLQQPPDAGMGVIFDLCRDEHDVLWSLRAPRDALGLALYAHDAGGRLLSSRDLDLPADPSAFPAATVLAARRGAAYVVCGDQLHCIERQRQQILSLHRPATGLLVSNPFVRPRVFATFDQGGVVIWPEDGHAVRFGEDLMDPVACFTRGGSLVVIGRGRGLILRVERQGITHAAPFEHSPEPPAAIVPTDDPAGFAVFFADGLVRIMKLPPE